MADVTDPAIHEAYLDVRDTNSDTNWLLLDYESNESNKLKVTQTGSGGLAELKESLCDANVSYGYARVTYSIDKESKREKFIFVVWIGKDCEFMRKAKVNAADSILSHSKRRGGVPLLLRQTSIHSAEVKKVISSHSIEVAAGEKDDLNEEPILERLRKAGGASYDGV